MSDQASAGRLNGGRGQGAADVRLVEANDSQDRGGDAVAQPADLQLVPGGQAHQPVAGGLPWTAWQVCVAAEDQPG